MTDIEQPLPINLPQEILRARATPQSGRIFTLMGPNGAGKSRALEEVERFCREQKVPVLRVPAIRNLVQDRITGVGAPDGLATLSNMLKSPKLPVGASIYFALDSIFKSIAPRRERSKEKLLQWAESGQQGPAPSLPRDDVQYITKIISRLLGYKTEVKLLEPQPPNTPPAKTRVGTPHMLRAADPNTATPSVTFATKAGIQFSPDQLSDGEKQILLFAWMLIDSASSPFVFLVDEPELYLNESRAIEFWEQLEAHYVSATFLYATHNIVFATRPAVTRTFLMGMDRRIEALSPDTPVPQSVVRDMVGARVQILRTSKPIVFCEDTLLRYIAADVLGATDYEFVLLEGHGSVFSAVSRDSRSWGQIRSASVPYCGIVDRDARSDAEVADLATRGLFCFPFFEAESLLLEPFVASRLLARANGKVENSDYIQVLLEAATHCRVATLRAIKSHLERWNHSIIEFDPEDHGAENVRVSPPHDLANKFTLRAQQLNDALAAQDVQAVLRLFDGKQLCSEMANLSMAAFHVEFGANPKTDYESLRRYVDFPSTLAAIPQVSDWAETIRQHLAT